jgi:succinoglycan biosynthesis transport protein ExoP
MSTTSLDRPRREQISLSRVVEAYPNISTDEITLQDLFRVIRRRRRIIGLSVVAVLLAGVLYCVFCTRRYDAVADLAINPEGSNALDMGEITANLGAGGLGFEEKLGTQVRILKSKSLAWAVIEDLRLDRDPSLNNRDDRFHFGTPACASSYRTINQIPANCREIILDSFAKSLTVESIPRTQAVEITFRSANPEVAREVVNHLAAAYTRRVFMTRYDDTMKASDWLQSQLGQIKAAAEDSQARLSDFQRDTGIFGTDENDNLVLSKLDDLSKELTDAEADRILKEAQYRIAQSNNPQLIGTIVPDSVLPVLRGQEADLQDKLAQANSEYGANYPAVIQLRNQLEQVQTSLQKETADIQERFRSAYQISSDTEKQMRSAFDRQKQIAYNMSEGLDQYGVLKREVEANNDLYNDLQKQLKEAGVLVSLRAATVDAIDLATLPTKTAEPKISLVLALSLICGFGLGTGLAFAAENLDEIIRDPDEFEALTNIPLFGVIPHIKAERRRPTESGELRLGESAETAITVLHRPQSMEAEAFRALRTSLQLASAGTPPKVVLISSTLPGEGKTTVSLNLAAALSHQGKRVLLVDGDLRAGTLGTQMNLSGNPGLSAALAGSGDWRDALQNPPGTTNLSVLQAGKRPPNSAELLGSPQMKQFLDQWRTEYDHVVIDSPPILLVTDAVLISQWVDVVLLVSRIGITPRSGFRRATEILRTANSDITGRIVNDISISGNRYGYGYAYGYGSHYGSKNGYFKDTEA